MKESPHSETGTKCSHCNKNRRIQRSQLNSKGLVAHVASSFFSLTTSLLLFVTARPRREKGFSCCDKEPLGSGSPATKHRALPGTACPGPCGSSPLPAPNPSRKRRGLSQGPYNPMMCSASLPTLPSRETLKDTLSSSDQASPSLSHIGLFGQSIIHSSSRPGARHPSPSLLSSAIKG